MSNYGGSAIGARTGGALSVNELQKHLSDYRRGRAYLSASTGAEIRRQHLSNGALPPKELTLYSQYSSAFGYKSKAYFAKSVFDVRETVKAIESAPDKAEVATEDLRQSLGYA